MLTEDILRRTVQVRRLGRTSGATPHYFSGITRFREKTVGQSSKPLFSTKVLPKPLLPSFAYARQTILELFSLLKRRHGGSISTTTAFRRPRSRGWWRSRTISLRLSLCPSLHRNPF